MDDKRYQVFVSSTFLDLQDERRAVMQTLLEHDCFPAGMELFLATDESQWDLIRGVIDHSDYYIVIIGARYGSVTPEGVSFTEQEFDYAVGRGLPVLGFVHRDPESLPIRRGEKSEAGQARLAAFVEKVEGRPVRYFSSSAELAAAVGASIAREKVRSPGVGWVRDSGVRSDRDLDVAELRAQITDVRKVLEGWTPPTDSGNAWRSRPSDDERDEDVTGSFNNDASEGTWSRASSSPSVVRQSPGFSYSPRRPKLFRRNPSSAELFEVAAKNAMSNAFAPLLGLLVKLVEVSDESTRAVVRAQIARSVAYAASYAIGPDLGVRSCVYLLADPTELRWTGVHAGRPDEPRSVFLAGTVPGDLALAMLADDSFVFCADTEVDPPPAWVEGDRGAYRTFLAAPVRAAGRAWGMLTVDSMTAGDLDPERDLPILTVLAHVLAVSRASADADDPA